MGDESIDAFVRYLTLNERFHATLVELAKSPTLARAIANVLALPFASPSALLSSHADLPQSREILVVAQHQHRGIVDALEQRQGSRAEEIAREHARISRTNLDLVLADREILDQLPGRAAPAAPSEESPFGGKARAVASHHLRLPAPPDPGICGARSAATERALFFWSAPGAVT